MTEWYNLTAVNATHPVAFIKDINDIFMQNQLGNLLLLMIFAVILITTTHFNNNPKINFMWASFAVAMFSIFFRVFGIVADFVPFLCWAMFAVSLMIVAWLR